MHQCLASELPGGLNCHGNDKLILCLSGRRLDPSLHSSVKRQGLSFWWGMIHPVVLSEIADPLLTPSLSITDPSASLTSSKVSGHEGTSGPDPGCYYCTSLGSSIHTMTGPYGQKQRTWVLTPTLKLMTPVVSPAGGEHTRINPTMCHHTQDNSLSFVTLQCSIWVPFVCVVYPPADRKSVV